MFPRLAPAAALVALAMLLALPASVAAHSELEASSPADGATVVSPPVIVGDFSEEVDPGRSSMILRDPSGTDLASGGVPADGPATRMTIADLPPLAPGRYEVRWTTVTPDDEGVERGTFSFTVDAATPEPTTAPGAQTSASPNATPAATPEAAPGAPPQGPRPATGGPGDLLIPLVALGAILAAGAIWLVRRRR
jgi:methionine-rich copper-binding protein CopC